MKTDQELNSLALRTRRLLGEDSYSPIDFFSVINGWKEKRITLLMYPLSERISGMCTKIDDDILICINSDTSYGRQRFTLAHELYHILYEDNMKRVICDMSMSENKSESEREADMFAGYILMSYDALKQYSERFDKWTLNNVIDAEQFYRISHLAMVYRLQKEKLIDDKIAEKFKDIKISREAAKLGYIGELFFKSNDTKKFFTTGEYIRKVEELAKNNKISRGKREELLLDAFRADIVFNLDEGVPWHND